MMVIDFDFHLHVPSIATCHMHMRLWRYDQTRASLLKTAKYQITMENAVSESSVVSRRAVGAEDGGRGVWRLVCDMWLYYVSEQRESVAYIGGDVIYSYSSIFGFI
jgi:hypothetical protein